MFDILCFKINDMFLYLEQILIELDFPIMFTCLDENSNRYVVLCIDYEEFEYIIAKSDANLFSKMLNKEIPIRDVFIKSKEIFIIKTAANYKNDIIEKIVEIDFENNYLPAKNIYFDIKPFKR